MITINSYVMKNLIFISIVLSTVISCKNSSKLTYNTFNDNTPYTYKMGNPKNNEVDLMKLTPFERALINTWPEMTEEQQNKIKSCLISLSKVDSLFYPRK